MDVHPFASEARAHDAVCEAAYGAYANGADAPDPPELRPPEFVAELLKVRKPE